MKRKPWTGQREYDKEHIKKVGVSLTVELAKEFAEVCQKNGVSMNSVLKDAIEQYIKDNR